MRALILRDFEDLVVEERPEPALAPGELRVRPHAVGICASDVHGYVGQSGRRSPGMVMGHEAAGVVVEVGSDVRGIEPGAHVAVNPVVSCGRCAPCAAGHPNLCLQRRLYGCVPDLPGAFAGSFAVRAENAVPAPPDVPFEWLALCEPLAVGAHAAMLADPRPGRRLAVVGGGMIGLSAALAAVRRGADEVVVFEPDEQRRAVAGRLGLQAVAPPEQGAPVAPFDAAIEAVGIAATVALAVRAVGPRGDVVMVGLASPTVEVPASELVMEERRLAGSSVYTPDEFREVVVDVASGARDLEPLVGARLALDELPGAFADHAAGRRRELRTMLVQGS